MRESVNLVNVRATWIHCTVVNFALWIFRSGTDLILLLILFLFLLGRRCSKKPRAPSFQIGCGLNLAGCSSSEYASIDGVGFLIRRHTF